MIFKNKVFINKLKILESTISAYNSKNSFSFCVNKALKINCGDFHLYSYVANSSLDSFKISLLQ